MNYQFIRTRQIIQVKRPVGKTTYHEERPAIMPGVFSNTQKKLLQ